MCVYETVCVCDWFAAMDLLDRGSAVLRLPPLVWSLEVAAGGGLVDFASTSRSLMLDVVVPHIILNYAMVSPKVHTLQTI